ncbi:Clp protease N-terminal domain-containing protein [Egicoccus sp. AB-alg2]|uniref:Clp protease N-terminal domain-containing protein n=1 Tax=Egicoccus sp. AB-alg2 TaxID=3242693 RepID=UPI00359CFA3C
MTYASAGVLAAAARVARRLRQYDLTEAHLLAGVLDGPVTAGRRALEAVGLTADVVERELAGRAPAAGAGGEAGATTLAGIRELLARSEGVAIANGSAEVRAEDLLVALLWNAADTAGIAFLQRRGITTAALRDALVAEGVAVPDLPLPRAVELAYGPEVSGPAERWGEVYGHLVEVLGARWHWSWNLTDDGRFVVQAEEDADLPGLLGDLLGPGAVDVDASRRHRLWVDARAPHGAAGRPS